MAAEYVVKVERVILDADMRRTKSLVTDFPALYRKLRRGRVVMFLNRSGTMCRFIDAGRIVHTFYADRGETFNVQTIAELANARLLEIGLSIIKGKGVKAGRHSAISLPPRKRKAS